ncbi:presenilin-associated rhomboid-like protein, mitochondrial [Ptychodera flava]|uniref:presenilin-associated rhomboid-like protein, mitochondrial n=1 Tax=Ptychodera flava TaxID=63121 RepID=UPI003969FAEE
MPGILSRVLLKPSNINVTSGTWKRNRLQPFRAFQRKRDDTGRGKGFTPRDKVGMGEMTDRKKQAEIVKAKFNKKDSLEHIEVEYAEQVTVPFRRLIRPFFFAVGFTGCTFGAATIWQYEEMRRSLFNRVFGSSSSDLFTVPKFGSFRQKVNKWWNQLSDGRKVALAITAANVMVFLAWRVPAFQNTMLKWFTSNPASKAICWPMLFSTFSHYSLWHILINMYVLWSFADTAGKLFGKEQFLAMYLSTGVWASLASYVNKIAIGRYNPSLGASAAIMAVLGTVCTKFPDSQLQIIFLPFFSFSAGTGMMAIVGIETAGVLLRWTFFDHAGHLAGILLGWYYANYGHKQIWGNREPLMRFWHKLRGSPKES